MMLYAPLAVERLVAAVCVFRPYAAKPNRSERVSRLRSTEQNEAWP